MRFVKIVSEDRPAVSFRGKEMEKAEDLDPTGSQPTSKSTIGTPRRSVIRPRSELFQRSVIRPRSELFRKSVIRPRSELFPTTFRGESDQPLQDGESHIHFNEPNMKQVATKASSLTTLGLVGEKEVEIIRKYIYRHKKFNNTTRVSFLESHQNRPSVIVTHKQKGVDLHIDFDDIKVTSSEDDIEKMLNLSKFNVQNPTIESMHNLYFVDEAPFIDTLRNSFFAIWRTLPLGEIVMGDYIKFSQDKTATLPNYWMAMALKQTR